MSEDANGQLQKILSLGDFFALGFDIDSQQIAKDLEEFTNHWVQYNPYKPNNPRQGLSVTSLSGGLDGKPDLYSLGELYKREGVLYREGDFRTFTPVFERCRDLHPLLQHFAGGVGRTHFLRFQAGGHFPPHRDGGMMTAPDTFRILMPIHNVSHSSVAFLLDGRRLSFSPCTPYFVNTLLPHSLFSFSDDVIFLVSNIVISARSVERLLAALPEGPPWS